MFTTKTRIRKASAELGARYAADPLRRAWGVIRPAIHARERPLKLEAGGLDQIATRRIYQAHIHKHSLSGDPTQELTQQFFGHIGAFRYPWAEVVRFRPRAAEDITGNPACGILHRRVARVSSL